MWDLVALCVSTGNVDEAFVPEPSTLSEADVSACNAMHLLGLGSLWFEAYKLQQAAKQQLD